MYKISSSGKTLVGCNEDAWRTTPHIWFEAATNDQYAVCFTGSRVIQPSKFAAQSGMNEFGLVYSRLVAYTPEKTGIKNPGKKMVDPDEFLKDLLRSCKTLSEVNDRWNQYDRTEFLLDVFIYVDRAGNYLIVEPYSTTFGSDPTYLLSNFCPSRTDESAKRKLDRYRLGAEMVKKGVSLNLDYARSLSDEMHVCREKMGDGTLLTSIWNPINGEVNVYFYHDYDTGVRFNLAEEFAKGNHSISIETLFPENAEFKAFSSYVTPFNSPVLRMLLALLGVFFLFLFLFFTWSFFRHRVDKYNGLKLFVAALNLLLGGYMYVLATEINLYYFSAPYVHFMDGWVTASSYVPLIVLLSSVPILIFSFRILKDKLWRTSRFMLIINSLSHVILLGAFYYWGLLILI